MTSEHPSEPFERRSSRAADTILAASSPDVNAIFQGLVERFLGLSTWVGAFFSWWLANFWIICALGVPAMLAAAPLLDKMYQGDAAVREHQLEMFKLQTDVEIKKLDRALLGESAAKTLTQISEKLDQQAATTAQIQADMAKLAADVQTVRKAQAGTDSRVGAMQRQMNRQEGAAPARPP